MYLLGFMVILLAILWLFQICYLNTFYKLIKTSETEVIRSKVIDLLKSNEDDNSILQQINILAGQNNIAIFVADKDGNEKYNAEYVMNSSLKEMTKDEFHTFYQTAKDKGGSAKINYRGNKNTTVGDVANLWRKTHPGENTINTESNIPLPPMPGAAPQDLHGFERMESVIYVNIIEDQHGKTYVILINSILTPIDATVETLKIQLISISVIMIILSLFIAFWMSKKISKSIIRVNATAKELAKGNFRINFDGRDYREISELSTTLNFATSELGKTERLRRELIANISHDLRTPLTMIIAYSEVMRDIPDENTSENIQVVIDESKRLTNLVNDMLDISKLQAGVMSLTLSEFNFTESVESVLTRYNKLKEQDGYSIHFQYDDEVFISADEYKIYQVIYNLINNAINYTGEDKTVYVTQIKKEDVVRLEIKDSGQGIEKKDIPYVWDRYYKVDKTHKRAVTGTGLGLSIVKNILELHHAAYGVESEMAKGSTFWFEMKFEIEKDLDNK